jgi:hypothetical protein
VPGKKYYAEIEVDWLDGHTSLVMPSRVDDDIRTLLVCSCGWEKAFDSAPTLTQTINSWYSHLATVPAGSRAPRKANP